MTDNYAKIVQDNLKRLYNNFPKDLAQNLPGEQDGEAFSFNACSDVCVSKPLKAFKEFPDSMSYVGAFITHTEQLLVPRVDKIKKSVQMLIKTLNGKETPDGTGGNFSFIVYPLPKIALCYIFYEADDDFPASVTCLYSNNAQLFLPVDGLADVGEYCSKTILKLIE